MGIRKRGEAKGNGWVDGREILCSVVSLCSVTICHHKIKSAYVFYWYLDLFIIHSSVFAHIMITSTGYKRYFHLSVNRTVYYLCKHSGLLIDYFILSMFWVYGGSFEPPETPLPPNPFLRACYR